MLDMSVYIVPQHIWGSIPGQTVADYDNSAPIVGSGPFQLTQYRKYAYAVLTANPTYWGGAPKIDEVDFVYYRDADTMMHDLATGSLQGAWGLSEAQYRSSAGAPPTSRRLRHPGCRRARLQLLHGPLAGNPVLRDWRFRQALQWAVDHNKLVHSAYGGLATAGHLGAGLAPVERPRTGTGSRRRPGLHLRPGQGRPDADRRRLPAQERRALGQTRRADRAALVDQIELHVEPACRQADRRLVRRLGPQNRAVRHERRRHRRQAVQPTRQHLRARLRHVPLGLGRRPRPQLHFEPLQTPQIDSWNDCAWSDARYDKLFLEQQTTIDQTKRAAIVHRMEQIVYQQSPYIPTVYPEWIEAYNSKAWEGWQSTPGRGGGVFFTSPVMASYLTVHAVNVAAARRSSSRALPIALIAAIVATMVAVVVAVALMSRRARRPASPPAVCLDAPPPTPRVLSRSRMSTPELCRASRRPRGKEEGGGSLPVHLVRVGQRDFLSCQSPASGQSCRPDADAPGAKRPRCSLRSTRLPEDGLIGVRRQRPACRWGRS